MTKLFKALASFQQEVQVIHKGTQGFGYTYADLPTIFEVINPLLKKHGLGFTQLINTHDGDNYLNTIIFHVESGEKIESNTLVPTIELKGQNIYQSFGSGISYFRRYCISSALCLVTDKDTDGAGEQVKKQQPKNEPKSTKQPMDNKRFQDAVTAIANGKYTREQLEASFELTQGQIEILNAL